MLEKLSLKSPRKKKKGFTDVYPQGGDLFLLKDTHGKFFWTSCFVRILTAIVGFQHVGASCPFKETKNNIFCNRTLQVFSDRAVHVLCCSRVLLLFRTVKPKDSPVSVVRKVNEWVQNVRPSGVTVPPHAGEFCCATDFLLISLPTRTHTHTRSHARAGRGRERRPSFCYI